MVLSNELAKRNNSEMEKIRIVKKGEELFYGTIYSLRINRPDLLSACLADVLRFVVGVGLVADIL